jgi:type IV fimbrial biogenesis protein FimT
MVQLGVFRQTGVTLIELVVSLLIVVLLVAIASPSYQEYQRNARLATLAGDFTASVQLARAEAARRQKIVSMCPTDSVAAHSPKCSESSNFSSWIVFEDGDGDCLPIAGEAPIQAVTGVRPEEANRVSARGNGNCISFSTTGAVRTVLDAHNADRILVCDVRGVGLPESTDPSVAHGLLLDPQGRVTQTRQRQALLSWRLPCTPWSH